jgi:hypothetical protein
MPGATSTTGKLVADYLRNAPSPVGCGRWHLATVPLDAEAPMTLHDTCPTSDELVMVAYQESVLRRIAERSGLPLSEVGVMAATFLDGLAGRELNEVRRAAGRGYRHWLAEEAPAAWAS